MAGHGFTGAGGVAPPEMLPERQVSGGAAVNCFLGVRSDYG